MSSEPEILMRLHAAALLIVLTLVTIGCGAGHPELPRELAGFRLLNPPPGDAVAMPNGTVRHFERRDEGDVTVTALDNRIFNIECVRALRGPGAARRAIEKAKERYGSPDKEVGNLLQYHDGRTRLNIIVSDERAAYSLSDTELIDRALGESANHD